MKIVLFLTLTCHFANLWANSEAQNETAQISFHFHINFQLSREKMRDLVFRKITDSIFNDDLNKAQLLLSREPDGCELISSLLKVVINKRPPLEKLKARIPKFTCIPTSYTCDLKCRMCSTDFQVRSSLFKNLKYLQTKVFNRQLPWIKKIPHVIFSGPGETLNTPNIFDFLYKTKNQVTTVVSNGSQLDEKKSNSSLSQS